MIDAESPLWGSSAISRSFQRPTVDGHSTDIRRNIKMKRFCAMAFSMLAFAAQAELLQIPTGRGDKTFPVYWEKTDRATATVFLLAGGDGQVKFAADGRPRGNNFLIRTWQQFAAQKLNVAVLGTVDDAPLSYEFRISDDCRQGVQC